MITEPVAFRWVTQLCEESPHEARDVQIIETSGIEIVDERYSVPPANVNHRPDHDEVVPFASTLRRIA